MCVEPFHGAKVALFVGDDLLVIQRDDKPTILYPGHWDFPGGGREGRETPVQTVLRETSEETALNLTPADLTWSECHPAATKKGALAWFFVARLPQSAATDVMLGDEGQRVGYMAPAQYLNHPLRIPSLADRLARFLHKL